jgi:acetyltransferase-like isoleucine patch superfamily enzyme
VTLLAHLSSLRGRLADVRRSRLVAATTAGHLTPPPPSAFAAFGEGSWIVPPARVTSPECIEIGRGVVIHEHAWLSVVPVIEGMRPVLRIGDNSSIGRMCHIACVGEIVIGRDVLTAERVFIGDTYHDYADPDTAVLHQPMAHPAPVSIGDGAFLGIGSVILQGVSVGARAYVAAGAVVTSDVAPGVVVVGNPARPVRRWDEATEEWVAIA